MESEDTLHISDIALAELPDAWAAYLDSQTGVPEMNWCHGREELRSLHVRRAEIIIAAARRAGLNRFGLNSILFADGGDCPDGRVMDIEDASVGRCDRVHIPTRVLVRAWYSGMLTQTELAEAFFGVTADSYDT